MTNMNVCFSEKDYENAIKYYTEALELNPANAIYFSNRSLAYLRTECYGYALADATRALEVDKNYIKGYYRRATSNMAMGKFKAALKDYETVSHFTVMSMVHSFIPFCNYIFLLFPLQNIQRVNNTKGQPEKSEQTDNTHSFLSLQETNQIVQKFKYPHRKHF